MSKDNSGKSRVICSGCGTTLQFKVRPGKESVACPKCGRKIAIAPSPAASSPIASVSPSKASPGQSSTPRSAAAQVPVAQIAAAPARSKKDDRVEFDFDSIESHNRMKTSPTPAPPLIPLDPVTKQPMLSTRAVLIIALWLFWLFVCGYTFASKWLYAHSHDWSREGRVFVYGVGLISEGDFTRQTIMTTILYTAIPLGIFLSIVGFVIYFLIPPKSKQQN